MEVGRETILSGQSVGACRPALHPCAACAHVMPASIREANPTGMQQNDALTRSSQPKHRKRRITATEGHPRCRTESRTNQPGHLSHRPAAPRNPPDGTRPRHPHYPVGPGPRRRQNADDIHLSPQPWPLGCPQPPRRHDLEVPHHANPPVMASTLSKLTDDDSSVARIIQWCTAGCSLTRAQGRLEWRRGPYRGAEIEADCLSRL